MKYYETLHSQEIQNWFLVTIGYCHKKLTLQRNLDKASKIIHSLFQIKKKYRYYTGLRTNCLLKLQTLIFKFDRNNKESWNALEDHFRHSKSL